MTSSMRRALVVLGAATALGAAACTPPAEGPGTTTTTAPPDSGRYVAVTGTDTGDCSSSANPCLTIGYAVDQAIADETVHVGPGTYPELVEVDKALVFEGANAGTAAGVSPGTRGAESVVKGFRSPGVPHPAADQELSVTIDGFAIDPQGDPALLAATTKHLVSLFGGPSVVVANNTFDGGTFDPECTHLCTSMTDSALMVQSGTFTVRDNSFTDFRRPVDISQMDPAHPILDGTLTRNAFTHVTSRAIWLRDNDTLGAFPGVEVTDNSFDATGHTSPDKPAGVVVTTGGNTVDGNSFTDFGSGVFQQVCDGSNPSATPNSYTGNSFLGNRSGIQFFVVTSGPGCGPVDAVITGNSFEGNYGWAVRWNMLDGVSPAPNTLDASCNWWGAAGGAGSPGADIVTAAVDTTPWLTAPGGACDGS